MPGRRPDLDALARETFGWEALSDEQRTAIEQLLHGHDVLAVLPTGAGKSAIYQLPALLLDGVAVVVSPLLALQQDQIDSLDEAAAPDAVAVNSMESRGERAEAWQAVRDGTAEYLFLAPEQLARPTVAARLDDLEIGLFVVDEAHCVSAWGHDFRPDYLRLAPIIERLGHPPVVALTATAALPVRNDIVRRLGMRDPAEVVASFDRPNLRLAVERATGDKDRTSSVLAGVRALTSDPQTRRGLVYVASRKDAQRYAEELRRLGLRAAAYHAGRPKRERTEVQEQFMTDELDVVVATSAFGMGIDKPDVRFVVHAAAPESLDSYYQQIGRAGRDGEPAEIVLHYLPHDLQLQAFLTASRAPHDQLNQLAEVLYEAEKPLAARSLAERVPGSAARRTRAVNLLEEVGAVQTTADGELAYVDPAVPPEEAVADAVAAAEAHQRLVRSRIEMMRGYAETTGCRRQFLLSYFGEQLDDPCGNCDTCAAGTATSVPEDALFHVNEQVRHGEWGVGVVMSVSDDRLTVLFAASGYKVLSESAVTEHGLLEHVTEPETI
jgi:ATP-dependent DNA helicase RecQ